MNPGYYDAANTIAIFGRVRHDNATTGFVVNLESITYHQQYDDSTAKNDIAIMRMDRDVYESEYVKYLYLQPSQVALGTQVWAAGWGRLPDLSLPKEQFKVQLNLVRGNLCTGHGPFFSPQMICAGEGNGKDTCEGDSGSSIVYKNPEISNRWIGIGLTSFGGNPCGGRGVRGTYTNVSHYISWVEEQIPDWTQPMDLPSNATTTVEPVTEEPTTSEPDTTEEPYTEKPITEEPEEETEEKQDPSDFWYVFSKVIVYFISSVTNLSNK
jgi:secreted trypsin-like serine protease